MNKKEKTDGLTKHLDNNLSGGYIPRILMLWDCGNTIRIDTIQAQYTPIQGEITKNQKF